MMDIDEKGQTQGPGMTKIDREGLTRSEDFAKSLKQAMTKHGDVLPMEAEIWAAGADLDTAHFVAMMLAREGYSLVRSEAARTSPVGGWEPISELGKLNADELKRGVILAAFDPSDPYEDGSVGPQYIEWGNGPHPTRAGETKWLNFNSNNYAAWKPSPTHFMRWTASPAQPCGEK